MKFHVCSEYTVRNNGKYTVSFVYKWFKISRVTFPSANLNPLTLQIASQRTVSRNVMHNGAKNRWSWSLELRSDVYELHHSNPEYAFSCHINRDFMIQVGHQYAHSRLDGSLEGFTNGVTGWECMCNQTHTWWCIKLNAYVWWEEWWIAICNGAPFPLQNRIVPWAPS